MKYLFSFLVAYLFHIAPVPAQQITLPVEVFSATTASSEQEVSFTISNTTGIDKLWLKLHRPAYRDASVNPGRGAKASVKVNNGPWVEITNSNCTVEEPAASYEGITVGFFTMSMTLPTSKLTGTGGGQLVNGNNTIRFRFNGTDGITLGYRVLAFNFRKGNTNVIPQSAFVNDDPAKWTPPLNNPTDISAGRLLWETKKLTESPLNTGKILKAACAGCHAKEGSDLKYFNFSNYSIIKRSEFHGLTNAEAQKVASYIRSLKTPAPKQATPWNPPYQPGPGIDSKPVEEWAAGAGLDAVLKKDIDVLNFVDINKALHIDSTLNAREVPVPLQYPDWNAWLPDVHPLDIWGDGFKTTVVFNKESVNQTYERVLNKLANSNIDDLANSGELNTFLSDLARQTTNLSSVLVDAIKSDGFTNFKEIEQSLMHWGAIKTWEIMQAYKLEDKAPKVYGKYGEKRSWISQRRNVFELAPHRVADNKNNFDYQSLLTGKYFSTTWYQLQLTLNAGNRKAINLWPVDWNYQPNHIDNLHDVGGPKHPLRYVLSHAKMLQQYNDGYKVAGGGAIGFRQIHPGRYLQSGIFSDLDNTLRVALLEKLLNATIDLILKHNNAEWPRDTTIITDNTLRPSTYKPVIIPLNQYGKQLHEHHYEDAWLTMIPEFQKKGISCTTLKRLIDWGKAMWPKGNWNYCLSTETGNEIIAENDLKIYPNPATDEVNIDLGSWSDEVSVELKNCLGQTVRTIQYKPGDTHLVFNTAVFPPGVYHLFISAGYEMAIKKIIISR